MYSGHAAELGTGMGDVDGIFGDIVGAVKSVAAPIATFAGGAVGTLIAPGAGTAVGAYLGGKLGGALSSSGGGGGGGGAPAPSAPVRKLSGVNVRSGGPMLRSVPTAAEFARRSTATPKKVVAVVRAVAKPKPKPKAKKGGMRPALALAGSGAGMSTGAKVAIGAGGVGAAAALGLLAYRAGMI